MPAARPFTTPRKGRGSVAPAADRITHSARLKKQWEAIWAKAKEQDATSSAVAQPVRGGLYVEYEGVPGYDLLTKPLESISHGIRLLNVYKVPAPDDPKVETTRATVFIPTGRQDIFLKKLDAYANPEEDTPTYKPKNQPLMQSIRNIRNAMLESLWTDESDLMPEDDAAVWCEIWLSSDTPEVEQRFRETAASIGVETQSRILRFPERSVLLGFATKRHLSQSINHKLHILR